MIYRKTGIWISVLVTTIVFVAVGILLWPTEQNRDLKKKLEISKADPVETKKARGEYYSQLLRDPAINRIPANIRARELNYSRKLPSRSNGGFRAKTSIDSHTSLDISWQSAGPNTLGGRTRALGIDQRDASIILAGGVSGGIWKSVDGGNSWEMKSDPNQNMSVTSLAQDPTNPDIWYYASGEYGGSAGARQGSASYYGTGIFKSNDNGETWSRLASTEDTDASWNGQFDYISRIAINPVNGDIYFSANGFGVYQSTDGGYSFSQILGSFGAHRYTDVTVNQDGNILAVLSENSAGGTQEDDPGIHLSTDDGNSWTDITPTDFPSTHDRSYAAFAPSAPDTAYVFTYEGTGSGANEDVSFFMLDLSNSDNNENRSANLPDFGGSVGFVNTQSSYNMVVSVKPDDPDFVLVGGTNLFRSRDGFATKPANGYDNSDTQQKEEYWIGGYARSNDISQYPAQHPDQHVIVWEPGNSAKIWSGHDGGLSITSDITAAPVTWQDKDEGYITSQFYTVAISPDSADNRIMGGTQDNGTPYFTLNDQNVQQTSYSDISSGDGAYSHIGNSYIYSSSQRGRVIQWNENLSSFNYVAPLNAKKQLFIHPYAVDPNDDGIMYYPGEVTMWRNTTTDEITNSNGSGTTDGWESFEAVSESGYRITSLTVTESNPSDRLYYAASSGDKSPKIFYVDEASTTDNKQEISVPSAPSGAYVHNLAVNPRDGNEVIAVMSNYNIVGLYHSLDGGQNWTAIEGNLEGDSQNPGPSIRNATILPTSASTLYFVGTSTGVYSTESLSGSSTQWTREADDGSSGSIGYSVAEYITSRPADGKVAVGTHGRGIFMANVTAPEENANQAPAAPTNVLAELDGSDVVLNWDPNTESDLAEYAIYRGLDSQQLELYATINASSQSYVDTDVNQQPYYYAVSALDGDRNESPRSEKKAIFKGSLEFTNDWQLLSSPLTSSLDASGADANIFGFEGAYEISQSLQPKNGYWVKSGSGSSIEINSAVNTSATISLQQGWNLIGGIVDTVVISNIEDPGDILSNTDPYEYQNGTYQSATQILPTKGYWIHATASGDIILSIESSSSKHQKEQNNITFDAITFRRGNSTQQFYVSESSVEDKVKAQFRMPPPAPNPSLDVRTEKGYRIADEQQTKLEMTSQNYPVTVHLSTQASSSYRLKGVTARDTVKHNLLPGQSIDIQHGSQQWYLEEASDRSMISEHGLLPNYPNPFNPTTNVRYQLASETDITLDVFNVLGQKVQTLVDRRQESGSYTVPFNGQSLSSGIYFIHLKTGNKTEVQKMTLVK